MVQEKIECVPNYYNTCVKFSDLVNGTHKKLIIVSECTQRFCFMLIKYADKIRKSSSKTSSRLYETKLDRFSVTFKINSYTRMLSRILATVFKPLIKLLSSRNGYNLQRY